MTNESSGIAKSREEIIEKLNKRAAVYVPEWRIPDSGHDAGSVLTYLYADTQYQLGRQMAQLAMKHKNGFFRCLDTSVRPAVPARGYVVLDVEQDNDQSIPLPSGTALTTSASYPDELPVSAKTEGNMELTPSTLVSIYESSRGKDYIGCLYEKDPENPGLPENITFFVQNAENEQTHRFYLNHAYAFSGNSASRIEICFSAARRTDLRGFLDKVRVSYWTDDGWVLFEEQHVKKNSLILKRGNEQPFAVKKVHPEIPDSDESMWLCFSTDLTGIDKVELEEINIGGKGVSMPPNAMISDGIDSLDPVTAPFGDKFQIYNEWYVACDDALSQKGALIHLNFTRSFVKTEIGETESVPIEWKLIMKKGDIRVEKDYDITATNVIWEYFNGYGWTRLCDNKDYETIFGVEDGTQDMDITMKFICPSDMSKIHVGGSEAYYIRARVLKITNAFKTKGFYITPVLKKISFDYEYGANYEKPEFLALENNLESTTWLYSKWRQQADRKVLWGCEDEQTSVYLGFDRKLSGGPLSLLFNLVKQKEKRKTDLQLEYFSGGRWKAMNPVDETENLVKTGLVIFYGKQDMQKIRLFGKERYWLRIRDIADGYLRQEKQEGIKVKSIYQNAVKAVAVQSGREQFFMMNRYREHAKFEIQDENIAKLDLWVRERWNGTEELFKELKKRGEIKETDNTGVYWIKWKEISDFCHARADEKCYVLDHSAGIILFGDGRHGQVPPAALEDTIHVSYSVGGGHATNMEPGMVDGLEESSGAISRVYNPLNFQGGYDRESVDLAVSRVSHRLKHRDRAVTTEDYEDLAFEIDRNVTKARCFSGHNASGDRQKGCLTLVLLMADGKDSDNFHSAEEKLYGEFKKHIPITVSAGKNFFIIPPVFIRFNIRVELYLREGVSSFDVRTRLVDKLREFFHPEHGGYDKNGWEVGQLPEREEIQAVITGEKSIRRMKNLIIVCEKVVDGEYQEMSFEQASGCMYTLPLNGEHELVFQYET